MKPTCTELPEMEFDKFSDYMILNHKRRKNLPVHSRRSPLRNFTLLLLAMFVIALLVIAIVVAPTWLAYSAFAGVGGTPTQEQWAVRVSDERRSVLWIIGGILAIIGLVYTALRHRLSQAGHELQRDANRTDRYASAIQQLGSNKLDVRLGGIYALERIALDSERDRGAIGEVLSAFVREHTQKPAGEIQRRESAKLKLATDVQAVLTVLGRRPDDGTHPSIDLTGVTLIKADFSNLNFAGAKFADADLRFANFRGANLAKASFTNSKLGYANLSRAKLSRAIFDFADLRFAALDQAELVGARLREAILCNTRLQGASLARADLTRADLSGAQFVGATLSPKQPIELVDLSGAILQGARISPSALGEVDLTYAQREGLARADSF